jgi:hypothetical protein
MKCAILQPGQQMCVQGIGLMRVLKWRTENRPYDSGYRKIAGNITVRLLYEDSFALLCPTLFKHPNCNTSCHVCLADIIWPVLCSPF